MGADPRGPLAPFRTLLLAGQGCDVTWTGDGPDVVVLGSREAADDAPAPSGASRIWVRLSALFEGAAERDLAAALPRKPEALLLAGAIGARDVEHLSAKLSVVEAESGIADRTIAIVALADRAASIAAMPTLSRTDLPRLAGLCLDLDALRTDLGCGPKAAVLAAAAATTVLTARSGNLPAILALSSGPDPAGYAAARSEGFTAILVSRPDAVAAAAKAFRPGSDARSRTSSPASPRNNPRSRPA